METSDRPQVFEYIPQNTPLQDGGDPESESPYSVTRRFHGETKSSGCLPQTVPMNKQIRQLLRFQVCLGRQNFGIFIPPIRAGPSPVGFYETVETSSSISKGTGHPPPHLPGRHAADGSVREAVTVPCRDNKWALTQPGIHPELQELPHRSKTDNGIPGFHSGLRADDPLSSQCKGLKDQEGVLSCTEPITCFSKAISQANWPSHFLSTSNRASPSSLQSPTEAKEPGSSTRRPLLQPKDHPVPRESAGSPVVEQKHINKPTKAYPQALSSPHSGNRCFPDWVGGVLSELRGVHREHLDSEGSKAPYQLARIKRSISCPSMLCETPEQFPHFTPNGQPSGHNLYQQKGGHEIKSTLRPSSQGVDMVLGDVNYSGARHLPGHQNTRADFESRHQTDSGNWHLNKAIFKMMTNQMGDCSIDLFASYKNTQLKKFYSWRPDPLSLASSGRSGSKLEELSSAIPLPPNLSHRTLPPENKRRRSASCPPGGTPLALTDLVPFSPGNDSRCSQTPPLRSVAIVTDPLGNPHPLQIQESLNLVV